MFGISAGWAVVDRLVVHLAFTIAGPGSPDLVMEGVATHVRSSDTWGYGPGITYYLPHNFYLTGTGVIARLSVESLDGRTTQSARGPGAELMAGKEWWISENWGLGVAAKMLVAHLPGGDLGPGSWQSFSGGVVFSATYN
jgi:hypothetical protein